MIVKKITQKNYTHTRKHIYPYNIKITELRWLQFFPAFSVKMYREKKFYYHFSFFPEKFILENFFERKLQSFIQKWDNQEIAHQ